MHQVQLPHLMRLSARPPPSWYFEHLRRCEILRIEPSISHGPVDLWFKARTGHHS